MRPQDFALPLEPGSREPLYLQIARSLSSRIAGGHLAPGTVLPGARQLAEGLGVNRKTAVLAYQELEAEGWIRTQAGRGPRVARPPEAADPVAPGGGGQQSTIFDFSTVLDVPPAEPGAVLDLREGGPDPRLLPSADLGAAYRRGLEKHGAELLHYGEPRGHEGLREALARWLTERRGLLARPEHLLVTRGTRAGLVLLLRALPGEPAVAVEEGGSAGVQAALREAGARILPVPGDDGGLRVDVLAARLAAERIQFLHLSPHACATHGASLPEDRRAALLRLAEAHRFVIAEDDAGYEFHHGERPALPLGAHDPKGVVVGLGSFAQLLAPGIRVGYLVARGSIIARLARAKAGVDFQGDRVLEGALAELMRSEILHRHVRRARKAYAARRYAALACLARLPGISLAPPRCGLGIWTTLPDGFDAGAFVLGALERGVLLAAPVPARDGSARAHLRFGFGPQTEAEWEAAFRSLEPVYVRCLSRGAS